MKFNEFGKSYRNIPLSLYNTFGIGGNADIFVEVATKDELKDALFFAIQNNIPYYILGGGTNVLASDEGFNGIVIKIKIQDISFNYDKKYAIVGAGVPMGALLNKAKNLGLSGLEWAAGLPGTLGGAIFGNAGSCGGSIADNIDFVEVLDPTTMTFKCITLDECNFKYRSSNFKKNGLIIIGAMLKLRDNDSVEIMNKMSENMLFRRNHQPLSERSEGCVFKNVDLSERRDIPLDIWSGIPEFSVFVKKGVVPAGFLIDRAGLKEFKIGGAKISDRHANFIVNEDNAKAKDIYDLIYEVKKRVKEKFMVELEEEVQFIGFKNKI
ncbi:MAG: UDP-N-acetylmuramate dehydrogenase [Patescibacteria group bacterium]